MAFGGIVLAWAAVAAWLVARAFAERRWAGRGAITARDAGWRAAWAWVAALVEWSVRSGSAAARITQVVASGGRLARTRAS
jgi:hypothetical protein